MSLFPICSNFNIFVILLCYLNSTFQFNYLHTFVAYTPCSYQKNILTNVAMCFKMFMDCLFCRQMFIYVEVMLKESVTVNYFLTAYQDFSIWPLVLRKIRHILGHFMLLSSAWYSPTHKSSLLPNSILFFL